MRVIRNPFRSQPVRWQITVLHTTILMAVLLIVGTLVWTQQRAFLLESTATRLRAQSRPLIEAQLGAPPADPVPPRPPKPQPTLPVSPPTLDAALRETLVQLANTLSSRETAALILTVDGTTLAHGSYGPPVIAPDLGTVALAASGELNTQFIGSTNDERMLAVVIPLWRDGKVVALAQVSTGLRPVDDALARLARYLVLGGLLAIGLATALGVRATRVVLRPLDHMVAVTQRITAGDLSLRVGLPPGRTEIATLGTAFDAMLARLEATFVAQRRFVADAAHELRTPLTALSGAVELLENGVDAADPARTQRMLNHLDTEINRMIRLTNDLLTLSALDAQPRLALRPLDVSQLVQELGEHYQTMLAGQVLALDITPDLYANADADKLRQVLLNVLDNARKYTPTGGVITVRVHTEPHAWPADGAPHSLSDMDALPAISIDVQDSGAGIPADALPHLFERFYRVDTARTRAKGGSGLGLAIAQALVRAHGGRISVKSGGDGTIFTITLPQAASSGNVQLSSVAPSVNTTTLHT